MVEQEACRRRHQLAKASCVVRWHSVIHISVVVQKPVKKVYNVVSSREKSWLCRCASRSVPHIFRFFCLLFDELFPLLHE